MRTLRQGRTTVIEFCFIEPGFFFMKEEGITVQVVVDEKACVGCLVN